MADNPIGLTPAQFQKLISVVKAEVHRVQNPRSRPADESIDHQEFPAPESYFARTPAEGIPAMDLGTGTGSGSPYDDKPGSAECQIYRTIWVDDEKVLKRVDEYKKLVYNISDTSIGGGIYVPIWREKWEDWYTIQTLSEGGCADPGYDHCRRVVLRAWSECVSGAIVSHEIVEYWRFCNGRVISFSDTPCFCVACTLTSSDDPGNTLTLTASGVTSGDCGDCSAANGTFTITRTIGPQCIWQSNQITTCSGATTTARWILGIEATETGVRISASLTSSVGALISMSYYGDFSSCSMPVTLNNHVAGVGCVGVGGSVTIS